MKSGRQHKYHNRRDVCPSPDCSGGEEDPVLVAVEGAGAGQDGGHHHHHRHQAQVHTLGVVTCTVMLHVKLSCYHSRLTWEDPDVEAGHREQGEGEEAGGRPGEHQEAAQRAVQGRVGLHRGAVLAPPAAAAALHVTRGNILLLCHLL